MLKYIKWLLFLSSLIIFLYMPYKSTIVIEAGNTGKVLAYIPLQKTDRTFHILYTHSIHLSDVKETYEVLSDGTIRQVALMYEDTSIGMPSHAENGELFEIIDGKYYIRNMKRDFPSIYMRVGQVVASHKLIVNGEVHMFSSFVDPGALIKIRERRLTLWQLWKGVNIVGRKI